MYTEFMDTIKLSSLDKNTLYLSSFGPHPTWRSSKIISAVYDFFEKGSVLPMVTHIGLIWYDDVKKQWSISDLLSVTGKSTRPLSTQPTTVYISAYTDINPSIKEMLLKSYPYYEKEISWLRKFITTFAILTGAMASFEPAEIANPNKKLRIYIINTIYKVLTYLTDVYAGLIKFIGQVILKMDMEYCNEATFFSLNDVDYEKIKSSIPLVFSPDITPKFWQLRQENKYQNNEAHPRQHLETCKYYFLDKENMITTSL